MNKYETIEELLIAPEGERYQFKEAKNRYDYTDAMKICCALANCGGGKLVFGITDKRPRSVVGSKAFEQPERARENLMDALHVRVDFQLYEHDGKRVLVFAVASRAVGLPVQADGIAWWYKGDSLIPMPEEVRINIYAESGHDFSDDICEGATIADLDNNAIEIFRGTWAENSRNKRVLGLMTEQLMRDCEAVTDKGVTYAALILFGTRAGLRKYLTQAEFVFEYRSKETAGPAAQREEFRDGFFNYYDRIWELVNLRNDKQHYQEGFHVFGIPTFNESVVREAVLNAVSHRSYQLPGSIFLRQYRDRLVVESPGGFPWGITVENILDRQAPRNRRIADIFQLCGLVERSGQGMNLIYEMAVREAKPLPDFRGTDVHFVKLTLNGLVLDKRMLNLINKIGDERLEVMITEDFIVVDALFREQKLTPAMRERIKRLVDMGIVEHTGRGKYVLARNLYEAAGKSGVHTRIDGLDRETNKELILKHIRESGDKGTPFKELRQVLPSRSRKQIHILLNDLRNDGKIELRGKTNNATWHSTSK
ncbi:MAG: putative DNA binding domain-containing protein [Peptococcaceae bacterium]|jgi:ATP-dependent DNA helicase RecG|nr:putative DNA binding domain-containing protein [Peptococcaceae bacterium]